MQIAAKREVEEEAGVHVKLTGVLSLQYTPYADGSVRFRVVFLAEPVSEDRCTPKTLPDFESAGACWVTLEEVTPGHPACLPLRGSEPSTWFKYVASGGYVAPMSVFSHSER